MSSGPPGKSVMQHLFKCAPLLLTFCSFDAGTSLILPEVFNRKFSDKNQDSLTFLLQMVLKWFDDWSIEGCSGLVMPSWFTTIILLHEMIRQLFRYMSMKSLRTRLYSRFLDVCSRRCLTNTLSAQPPPVLFWFTPNNIFEEVLIRRHCLQFKLNIRY